MNGVRHFCGSVWAIKKSRNRGYTNVDGRILSNMIPHTSPSQRLPLLTLASSLLALSLNAQVTTWTGYGNLATILDWNNPTHWNTGVAPDGAGQIVQINQVAPATRNFPNGPYLNATSVPVVSVTGGALPVITGSITLDSLRFDLPAANSPYMAALYVGFPTLGGTTGALRLEGQGIDLRAAGGSVSAELNVTPGSSLTLAGQAQFTRTNSHRLSLYLSTTAGTTADPSRLLFRDDARISTSTARWVTIYSRGPSSIIFQDRAQAGNAIFNLGPSTTTEFHNTASAESAQFNLGLNNLLLFAGDSTAANSQIDLSNTGFSSDAAIVRFMGRSSAGQATVTGRSGVVEFIEQATANSNNFSIGRLDISGAAVAGGTTGRQRAGSSQLAPNSVVATDARTISVGTLRVGDVLLGSNTLELTGGYIFNLRDSGGAYLSANGDNLIGGGLLKTGSDTLTLYGPAYDPANPSQPSYNVITGNTTVRQGQLILYNRLADVVVESAGTLRGHEGIVNGRLANHGTVRLENTTLQVAGDYLQTATGNLDLSFGYAPGYFAKIGLTIGGNARLSGAITPSAHPYFLTQWFPQWKPGTIDIPVLAASSLTGRFDTMDTSSLPARIEVTPLYTDTNLALRFAMLPFTALGQTPGARAFGSYLDQVYRYTGNYFPNNYNWLGDHLTFATDRTHAARILADAGPGRYGTVLEHGWATAMARRMQLDQAVGGNQVSGQTRSALFLTGEHRRLTYAAVDGLPVAKSSTSSWLAGGRWRAGPWTLGGYVVTEKARLLLDETGSTAKTNSVEPGLFFRYNWKTFFVQAGAGFSHDRYELQRVLDFSLSQQTRVNHTASPDGQRTDWSLTAGHTWQGKKGSFSPFAGVLFSRWQIDDFTETADNALNQSQLQFEDWSRNSHRTRVGFTASTHTLGGRLQPRLTVAWWHDFTDDRSIPTRLIGAPSAYLAPGRPVDTDLIQATLALDYSLSRNVLLFFNASGGRGRHTTLTSNLSVGLQRSF